MPQEDPNELIQITHSKGNGEVATCTREAFNTVWKDKGWREASDKQVEEAARAAVATEEEPKK